MKVAIATVQVPFLSGGAEVHAEGLRRELVARGARADIVSIPFKWYPPERLLDCMMMARLMDLTEVNGEPIDRVIALKFPAYFLHHPNKVAWILHQHRQAYELFGTAYGDLHQTDEGRRVAREIHRWDRLLIPEHRKVFANSKRVAQRLSTYCGIEAPPLYHPPGNAERLRCGRWDRYILYPGRFDSLKRQHLIVEAMRSVRSDVKLVLVGSGDTPYGRDVAERAAAPGVRGKIELRGFVSEEEKIDLYANALAVYNGVYEEDYGYVTLEAFLSGKPVITHPDSGGPTEFVSEGVNGRVVPPQPEAIAAAIDDLAGDPARARAFGAEGRELLQRLGIAWDDVIDKLLS